MVTGSAIACSISACMSFVTVEVVRGIGRKVAEARRVGAYTLVEKLGEGGMGEVWRAEHQLLARPAAVKLIKKESLGPTGTSGGEAVLRRFEREAQATARLGSHHTVNLYDFGIADDGTFYYVMELLDGLDLDSLVERFGPVPAERCVHLLIQACRSLEEAHAQGLVHRDIKPANLFACRLGLEVDVVKVLDFGLVKATTASVDQTKLTTQNTLPGTPAFMAPEAIEGATEVGAPADVYALGCVAYWLLTGRLLFEASTPIKMAMAHVSEAVTPLTEVTEIPLSAELDELIMRCLSKRPEERPTVRELRVGLEAMGREGWDEERMTRWWERHVE